MSPEFPPLDIGGPSVKIDTIKPIDGIYFHGSPELGYVSQSEIIEFVRSEKKESVGRLTILRNEAREVQFAERIFSIMKSINDVWEVSENGIYYSQATDDSFVCEVAVDSKEAKSGVLVNLDALDAFMHRRISNRQPVDKHVKTMAGVAIQAYLTQREILIGEQL